jgi:hypothetical protein
MSQWGIITELLAVLRIVFLSTKRLEAIGATSLSLGIEEIYNLFEDLHPVEQDTFLVPLQDVVAGTCVEMRNIENETFFDGEDFPCQYQQLQSAEAKEVLRWLRGEIKTRFFHRQGLQQVHADFGSIKADHVLAHRYVTSKRPVVDSLTALCFEYMVPTAM